MTDFLQAGNSLVSLSDKYHIIIKRHKIYSNLVLFKYNQIDSPMSEPIVIECRGLILDESDNWKVISWPFNKFFNAEEGFADKIDWPSARVLSKLDGSLAVLYFYNNQWHVSTSGTPDASGNVNSLELSFNDYFWNTFNKYCELPNNLDENYCFMFELTGPQNRVVVVYNEPKITLIGARNRMTGQEITPKEAANFFKSIPIVEEFPLNSIDNIIKTFEYISPLVQEGYVVVDKYFRRIKVKHPGYIALHHAKSGLGTKAFVEIVRSGEVSEVISAFPEFKVQLDEISIKYNNLIVHLESEYEKIKNLEIQKDFAKEALKTKCSSALFALRAKKVSSIKSFLTNLNINSLMELL